MRLIDLFPTWSSSAIFTKLGTLYGDELPWATQRGQILDQMYLGAHSGDKTPSPLIERMTSNGVLSDEALVSLVNILFTLYSNKWDKLYAVMSAEYNPIENYSMVEVTTPNITRVETPNITRGTTMNTQTDVTVTSDADSATDIYGFNSVDPVPQGENLAGSTVNTKGLMDSNGSTGSETETGTRTYTETGTSELTRSGNIGVTTSQQMLESEITLWQWNFYESVFKDLDKVLTTPKYNY